MKKPEKRLLLPLMVFLASAALLPAEETPAVNRDVEVSIRHYDKRIYFVAEDPIFVQVTITNRGTGPYRFRLADEREFSVVFDVRTVSNRVLEKAASLERKWTTNQQVFFREITIESGESFSFVEDIRDYAALTQSGAFVVQARVYPGLYRTMGIQEIPPLESNRLTLNIRPSSLPGPDGIPLEMDAVTNAILVRERISPDEVIRYTLAARQKGQWEKFFLYLDLESMITRDGARSRQWLAASEEGRQQMLARYRSELQGGNGELATIPREFEIQRTTYTAGEGTVIVLEKFQVGDYTERKRYTYTLRYRDGIWTIVDYLVINLGTE
ncbi:hypothetical protein FACS1894130_05740 [Spirochaetia bacterium]|nr:hypothetical protein FACS1894130_05740 [Spirochaetia bacterium]